MPKKKTTLTVAQLAKNGAAKQKKSPRQHTASTKSAKSAYKFVSENQVPAGAPKKSGLVDQLLNRVKSKLPEEWTKNVEAKVRRATQSAQSALVDFEKRHLAHRDFYQTRIRPLLHPEN